METTRTLLEEKKRDLWWVYERGLEVKVDTHHLLVRQGEYFSNTNYQSKEWNNFKKLKLY